MADIILHQYQGSPFSEKIRLVFGYKGLAWKAVEIPSIMPKPDLMPLTGGYRRTPVMQIGADIYCDTQLILRELERRFPEPSLCADGAGFGYTSMMWTDRAVFQAGVGLVFGNAAQIDPAFVADREKMTGQTGTFDQMAAIAPHLREQLRGHLDLIETQLSDGRAFLNGANVGLADFNLYHVMWFLEQNVPNAESEVFGSYDRTSSWIEHMSGFGHGDRTDIGGSTALDIARDADPETGAGVSPGEPNGLTAGQQVAVMPDDYARDPVTGELVLASAQEVAIKRHDDRVGDVVVHFPRIGFVVQPV